MIGGAVFVGGREASIGSGGGAWGVYFSCFSMSDTVHITSRVFYNFSNCGVEGSRIEPIVRYVEHSSRVLCSDLNYVFREEFVVNSSSRYPIFSQHFGYYWTLLWTRNSELRDYSAVWNNSRYELDTHNEGPGRCFRSSARGPSHPKFCSRPEYYFEWLPRLSRSRFH